MNQSSWLALNGEIIKYKMRHTYLLTDRECARARLRTNSKKLTRLGSLVIVVPLQPSLVRLPRSAPPFPFEHETVVEPPGLRLSLTFDLTSLTPPRSRTESKAELWRQQAGTEGLRQGKAWKERIRRVSCFFFFKLLTTRGGTALTWERTLFLMCALKDSIFE